jgi:hypothetical protein
MDPLFSQPYQPAHVVESSVPAKHDGGSISTSRSGKPAQQVAALFLPPTRKSA